jgi:hypothetical protein
MQYHSGAIALTMFAPVMRQSIIDFVVSAGSTAFTDVALCQSEFVKMDPALGFLKPKFNNAMMGNLARSLRLILGDALAGQWDTEKYATALNRSASIPMDEAHHLASDFIVTRDAGVIDFARRLLRSVPDLPGPVDDAVGALMGGVFGLLERSLPNDWANHSGDVLYEWYNMGEQLGKLSVRADLTVEEILFEKAPLMKEDRSDALSTVATLAKAVLGLLGSSMEFGDVMDPEEREEIGDVLGELGDLLVEGYYTKPEQGSFGSFLKRVGKVAGKAVKVLKRAAPMLGGIAGGLALPGVGALAGSGLSKILGNDQHAHSALQQAHAKGASYPQTKLTPPPSRVTLSDLIKTIGDLRAAGVSLG